MLETQSEANVVKAAEPGSTRLVVMDLGKQKSGAVKKLRKGKGRLMEDIAGMVNELKASGALAESAPNTLVVIVERLPEEKEESSGPRGLFGR